MDFFAVFAERFPESSLEREFSFAAHTTIGCGGKAAVAASPASTEECAEMLSFLKTCGIPYCFLGAGANVLPSDEDFDGIVFRFHRLNRLYCMGATVYAGAGVSGSGLVSFAREQDLSGFEKFAGIPMTVGGGIAMNAGIADGHFSDLVERVVGIEQGKIRTFTLAECDYAEKHSVFLSGIAVTGAYLRGCESFREQIDSNLCYYRKRREHLPKGRSMGCTFVNPDGKSAGELIDRCGLKGIRIGGARVSERHANFIINEGGTANDVARLIETIKREVEAQTGIILREEIQRLPRGSQH